MKKISFIICIVLISLSTFPSCDSDEPTNIDNKTEQESQESKDPDGTKTTCLTKNSNSTNILSEQGYHDGVRLDNNNILRITEYISGKFGQHIQSVGQVNSLSDIKTLPEPGNETSAIPNLGEGYIFTFVGESMLDGIGYSGYHEIANDIHYYPKTKYIKARVSKILTGLDGNPSGIELKYCEYNEAMDRKIEPLLDSLNQWKSYSGLYYYGIIPLKYPVKCIVKEYPDFVSKIDVFDSHIRIILRGAPGGWSGKLVLSNPSGEATILLDAMTPWS